MKGVILAAGISSRLRPLTDGVPKCLLEVGPGTILGMTIENLIANGIGDVVIVTGYRGDQIRAYVRESFPALDAEFVTNDRYEKTNNIYSLFLTESAAAGDDIVLLDSDIVFDRRIIGLLRTSGAPACLAVASGPKLGDEEIKVQTGPGGAVLRIGKDVPPAQAAGESIGIELIGREFLRSLYAIFRRMFRDERNVNLFYEAAFQEAINEGNAMTAVDVGSLRCIEIDTPEDLREARRVASVLETLSRFPR